MSRPRLAKEPPRPALDTEDKREAILQAALELFAERGFHGTAMPLVAERAGAGAGTIYRYFESKEVLVNAVYQRWKGALHHALMDRFPVGVPFRQQFHELWMRFAHFAKEHTEAFRFLELHHHAAYLDETSRDLDSFVIQTAEDMVERARQEMALRDLDPRVMIALVWGSLIGLVRANDRGYETLSEPALHSAEECLWAAVRR